MHFRSILSGTLAALFLSSGAAFAASSRAEPAGERPGFTIPLPKAGLPGVFSGNDGEPVRLAQAGDPRITALEEQVRQLSGTIEELNFQILQMQEQMRKMQEDNEFRFQEIEQKRSDAGTGKTTVAKAKPAGQTEASAVETTTSEAPKGGTEIVEAPATAADNSRTGEPGTGAPPTTFGTITFDANGNVKTGAVGETISEVPVAGTGGEQVAALPTTEDPEELYRNSYQFILSGDYPTAEAGFRDHIARFPEDGRASDAHFWLGESLLGQQKYRDAAEVFLAANRDYPSSKKAPDMLLKLGVSLVGLNQRDVACATFGEVGKKYPQASAALKERVKQEQALAAC